MNKFAIKAAAVCLSAAMMSAAMFPSVSNVKDSAKNSIVYAAGSKVGQNLIETPDCSSTKGYGLYLAGGAVATLSSKDGALDVDITNVGTLNYGVQLNHAIIPLYKNGVYKLSFDIKSDVERYTEALIQMDGGDYTSYVWTDCDVTTEWQTVEKEFTMEYDSDICSKLCFNMGNQKADADKNLGAHHFYVDNIKVEVIDDSQVDYSTFQQEEAPVLTNQLGYLPDAQKVAVLRGEKLSDSFKVVDASGKEVFEGKISAPVENKSAAETNYYADFSSVKTPGKYKVVWGSAESYEFEIGEKVYNKLLDETVYMLYTQRCGCEVKSTSISHPACHDSMATIYKTNEKIDVTGGWHDAGDYGRYVVPAAKTIADLFIAYNENKDLFGDSTGIPESGNGVADILDEARYELEWMLKMQDKKTGGVYHKVSCAQFPGTVGPEEETDELFVTPVSSTATADFCASMAMAYENFKDIDKDFAGKCLDAAKAAWGYLEANPNYVFVDPKVDITTGDYADFKNNDKDERYWAAAQMLSATGESKYEDAVKQLAAKTGLGWSDMGEYGSFAYLSMDSSKQNAELKSKIEAAVLDRANQLLNLSTKVNPYGEALGIDAKTEVQKYFWGCNMDVANYGMLLSLAEKIESGKGYKEAAAEQLNYLLGKNPLGNCFVTGYGTKYSENPHHRPSRVAGVTVPGMLVGGPDAALEDNIAKAYLKDAAPAKCYIDHADSYSTNEVTIYWNSPLTALIADVLSVKADAPEIPAETTVSETTPAVTTSEPAQTTVSEPEVTTVTTTETPEQTTADSSEDFLLGDVNLNGVVDITDVTCAAIYVIGDNKDFTAEQFRAADVDKDGSVLPADLARMLQYVKRVITKF